MSSIVTMAGTGFVRSCTKSSDPVSMRWSMNQVVHRSISGRMAATADGTRTGLITRRNAWWTVPSTSAMPAGGMWVARGMPMMPTYSMPSTGSRTLRLENVSSSRDTAATSS